MYKYPELAEASTVKRTEHDVLFPAMVETQLSLEKAHVGELIVV